MARPVITFLTDFGPSAPAVCRGVMFGIAPDANIIDINHQVPRYSIRDGAGSLIFALPHMPVGVHVAVVDPGVGTDRLGIAIKVARGDVLIGPDNGLLTGAAELLGGIVEVRSLENRDLMLPVVTSSFHGRDIFSPIAAHLAMGTPFESVGPTRAGRAARPPRRADRDRPRRRPRHRHHPRPDLRQRVASPGRRPTSRRRSGRWSRDGASRSTSRRPTAAHRSARRRRGRSRSAACRSGNRC